MTNKKIHSLILNVSDPDRLAAFYCDILGMRRLQAGDAEEAVAVGYGGEGAILVLRPSDTPDRYLHGKNDRYWKIALTLPNLDLAYTQLNRRGVSITQPHQFREIAYMSHLTDPEGHVIELIQHTFADHPPTAKGNPDLPLGGGAQIGLITLRTDDIDAELTKCKDTLGMRYLSRQSVSDLGFDLYFFAFTEEATPNQDVNAVENREWLWQRSYTVLEFQHLLNSDVVNLSEENSAGFIGLLVHRAERQSLMLR